MVMFNIGDCISVSFSGGPAKILNTPHKPDIQTKKSASKKRMVG